MKQVKLVLLVEKVCNESKIESLVTILYILEITSVMIIFSHCHRHLHHDQNDNNHRQHHKYHYTQNNSDEKHLIVSDQCDINVNIYV